MPILLTTLSKFRSIPWIDGVVRAIINVIISVYEFHIRHAGIENLVSVTAVTDFKFDVLPVVHDFVVHECGYGPNVVVAKMNLTPPTIEIVGFLGGSCKAHHHAACQAASYAVSHKKPRVWLSMSIQPLQVDQHTCLRSQLFECILL